MSNMTANFTLLFKDSFSNKLRSSVSKASKSFDGLSKKIAGLQNGSGLLSTVANMSLISGYARGASQRLGAMSVATSEVASNLESSMASVRSSLAMSVGVGKEIQTQYNMIASSAKSWSKAHADLASDDASTSHQMLSASESGNLLATVYNSMKLEGENANQAMRRMSDVITKTQGMFQLSNLNQLGEGLKYAVATANQAGRQLEQVSTIIGALNTAGLQGDQAGTAFATTLRGIDKTGKKLGFEVVYDDEGLNFIQTLENINEKFGLLETRTVAQQQALRRTFGDEGVRAINLLGGPLESLKTSYDAINTAQGTTTTMAGTMADTYKDKIQSRVNTLNLFKEQLGQGANSVRLWSTKMLAGVASLVTFNNENERGKRGIMKFLGGAVRVTSGLGHFASTALSATTGLANFMFTAEKVPLIAKFGKVVTWEGQGVGTMTKASTKDRVQTRDVTIHIDQVLLPKPDDLGDFVHLIKEFSAEVVGA